MSANRGAYRAKANPSRGLLLLWALLSLVLLETRATSAALAVSAEELLQKHGKALGGPANLEKVTGLTLKGSMQEENLQRSFVWHVLAPTSFREDLTSTSIGPALTTSLGTDGRAGWQRGPNGVSWRQDGTPAALARLLGVILSRSYLSPEYIELSASTPVQTDDKKAWSLVLSGRGQPDLELQFDAKSWLLTQASLKERTEPLSLRFEEYKKLGGVQLPMKIVCARAAGGRTATYAVAEANTQAELPAELFERPTEVGESGMSATLDGGARQASWSLFLQPGTGRAAIKGRMNDGEEVWWLLDTLSRFTQVDSPLVKELKLPTVGWSAASEGGGELPLLGVSHLRLGEVDLGATAVVAADLKALGQGLPGRLGGILGQDLFERLVVELRFSEQRANVFLPEAFTDPGVTEALVMDGSGRVTAVANGSVLLLAELATLRPETVVLPDAVVVREKLAPAEDRRLPLEAAGLPSDPERFLGALSTLQLGQATLDHVLVSFPRTPGSGQDSGAEVVIGLGVLSRFHLTVDRPRRQYLIERGPLFAEPWRYDRSGLTWREPGGLELKSIAPGILTTLKPGDRVLAVQEGKSWVRDQEAIRRRLSDPAGTTLRFQVQRGKKPMEAELTLAERL